VADHRRGSGPAAERDRQRRLGQTDACLAQDSGPLLVRDAARAHASGSLQALAHALCHYCCPLDAAGSTQRCDRGTHPQAAAHGLLPLHAVEAPY